MKYYIDANIIISLLIERKNKYGQSRHDVALKFFDAVGPEDEILISSHTITEVINYFERHEAMSREVSEKFVMSVIRRLKQDYKIIQIELTKELEEYAAQIEKEYKIHYEDALHVAAASSLPYEAVTIVTENISDFRKVSNMINIKHPKTFLHSNKES